jgi:hypothetical protein
LRLLRAARASALVTAVFAASLCIGRAAPPTPRVPAYPPLARLPAPPIEPPSAAALSPMRALSLPALKAVLVVGPIDGDSGEITSREKTNMDLAAVELQANGVEVHKFYTPSNDWDEITAAAAGAHFFLYRGHGVYWSDMPAPDVGGLALKGRFVSPDDIRNELDLAPNAIVMLYACFAAGSSSIDDVSITSEEAQRRVAQYSDPFVDVQVAGYYANWYGGSFQALVGYLFQGMTLGQAYRTYFDYDASSAETYVHPDHPDLAMWLDKDTQDGLTQYNNAFVGTLDKTLDDLFGPQPIQTTLEQINYLATPADLARTYVIGVYGTQSETFSWHASLSSGADAWMTLEPLSGTSEQSISVVITPTGRALGQYQASLQITSDSPDVLDDSEAVPITLRVVERVYSTVLPLVTR